jgi:alpha-L-fucosidase
MLYAIELSWPADGQAVIHSLASGGTSGAQKVKSVTLLGSAGEVAWQQQADGLHIQLPREPPGKYAYVFRIAQE